MPVTFVCQQCGKSFLNYPSNKPQFCSKACANTGLRRKIHPLCEQCGLSFEIYPSTRRGNKGRFCSPKCWQVFRRRPVICICEYCGVTFNGTKHNVNRGWDRYCSKVCANAGAVKQTTKFCEICSKPFPVIPSQLRHGGGRFCSPACSYKVRSGPTSATWKGGITPLIRKIRNSTEYKVWRKDVFQRDNYICRKCGKRGGRLTAHHLYRFAEFPHLRFSLNNGHTLCEPCHLSIKTRENEYLISIGLSPTQPPLF